MKIFTISYLVTFKEIVMFWYLAVPLIAVGIITIYSMFRLAWELVKP